MARIALSPPSFSHWPLNTGDGVEMGDNPKTIIDNLNLMLIELFGGTSTIAGNKTYSGTQQFNSTVNTQAGTSGASYGSAGNLTKSLTTIGSSATNTTQTLVTYALAGNSLVSVGNGVLISAWGRKANNAAGVTFQLNFGGVSINSGNITTSGGISWCFTGDALKSAGNAQQILFTGQTGSAVASIKSTSDTSVDTGNITISMQILDASAAQSNILLDGFVIEYFQ